MKHLRLSGTIHASRSHPAANSQKEVKLPPDTGGRQPPTSAGDGGHTGIAHPGKPVSRRLHRKQAASYIGTSVSWLDKSRLRGDSPAFLQIGGRVVYDTADLDDYLARCRRQSTSDQR